MNNFNKYEKTALLLSAIGMVLFSYLLWDDSLLDFRSNNQGLQKVGVLIESENDVRQKISLEYAWRQLRKGQDVYQGDSIFIGEKSGTEIELSDGSRIQIHENSLLILNVVDGNLDLNLNFGQVSTEIVGSSKLHLNSCGQEFEIDGDGQAAAFEMNKDAGCKEVKFKVTAGKMALNGTKVKKSETAILKKGKKPEVVAQNTQPAPTPVITQHQAVVAPPPPIIEKLPPPTITEPKNGYQHHLVYNDEGKLVSSPFFLMQWTYSQPATHFEFQIAEDSQFKKQITQRYAEGTRSRSPDLLPGKYYFRVREFQRQVKTTQVANQVSIPTVTWSDPVEFSITEDRTELKLAAPKLIHPEVNFKAVDTVTSAKNPSVPQAPRLDWEQVKGAHHYEVKVSSTNDPDAEEVTLESKETSVNWNEYASGQFNYRVFAVSAKNTPGYPSQIGTLKVTVDKPQILATPPKVVRAKNPDDPGSPEPFDIKWTPIKIAESYKIEISSDAQFKNPTVIKSREPASTITINKPGEYKWRVQPLDADNQPLTDFSEAGDIKYSLDVPLIQPKLIEPAANVSLYFQKNYSPVFWLEWRPVRQAEIYDIEISSQQDFSKIDYKTTTKTVRMLVRKQFPQGNIYWRVRARAEGKSSNWSDPRRLQIFAEQADISN